MTIKVKYLNKNTQPIEKIEQGDWIDLRAVEDIDLAAGQFAMIPLGVAMQLPKGYEAHIAPRSSTYKKWGILQVNSVGIVDESYCGNNDEWKMPVLAMRNTKIYAGDRICQFRIVEKQPNLDFEYVTDLQNEDRGGFGSTGAN